MATIASTACGDGLRARGAARPDAPAADPLLAFIDTEIRQTWNDNEVRPSDPAKDAEWLRRATLDIAGRIPTVPEIERFRQSPDEDKRALEVNRLLEDPGFVRHWTAVWTNLLIGRQTPERTSREGMERFLRDAFLHNRPWNEIVHDLLTAEGHFEENGAVNFLLGQLDGNPGREDYTVEATARATRLFLGAQVQCTQCHNHPFNDWKQVQFWEFDSFFKQMRRSDHRKIYPETGLPVEYYSELVWKNHSGPVYFEKRSGVMEVAYPRYADREIDPGPYTDRRQQLAKLLARDDTGQHLARAMVNRMWGHFFGYGFTRPVDDMGPHNPPSHPDLLDRLTQEFVAADYNLQQLIRWIANSEAYSLTSRFHDGNRIDNPVAGEAPLFSRMYVKPMTAEQIYDSLLVATGAESVGPDGFEQAERQRREWLREFLLIFGGNDEDEPAQFNGSISQALLMMNGPLVLRASSPETGGALQSVLNDDQLSSDIQRIRHLYLASLGRNPSRRESAAAQKMVSAAKEKWTAYQDLYWVLLNANEFVLNH
ncbi:MAG: DUF1549 and DUF1553 domain-containing protein [Planctomycetaceae bacterium]